ncbi:MAG: 16S rRNA (adenine(1518)-N(6)/adenine(1519)-N(6))-dimethyltransferase RsmA [Acidobacteria bacterium]|nr:16S rRNA (adenine(1518)-N(6)/adenine(1519)-N(6))-dimethyltransferase RsmA [Acidobacteriota bacterium]
MARQKLGQHFLFQEKILERIALAACGSHEPLVVEIGPGRGALTRHLLQCADRVIAIEVDAELVASLRETFAAEPRLEILHADVLESGLDRWGPAVVAGNLPYYISSPILERVAAARRAVRRAVFLLQKEVAERIAAPPSTRDYGYLTVSLRLFYDVETLFPVKPGAFRPPPRVDSAVVRLEPQDRLEALGLPDPAAFLEFVGRCFRQKRKTLRNNLAPWFGRERLDAMPEASARAEQLSVEQFAALYLHLVG